MRRFEKKYRVKSRDNLGDADYWNVRLEDIDLRLAAMEQGLADVDAVGARVEALALDRINNVVTPLVVETIQRVAQIPELFRANSASPAAIGLGGRQFVIDPGQRKTFAAMSWVRILPTTNIALGMTAEVVSFDRDSGILVVDVAQAYGSGTFSAWTIYVAAPPDLQHETRLDNPHGTTAAQVGAYTTAQVDNAIAALNTALTAALGTKAPLASPALTGTPTAPTPSAGNNSTQVSTTAFVVNAINALIGAAPGAMDTLVELAAALANDPNFAATMAAALAQRLRVDAAQGLNPTQQGQGRSNLNISAANTPSVAVGGILAVTVQAALAELDTKKAALADSDFTVLKVSGRRVYGPRVISATGGTETDLSGTSGDRLTVDFVASAPILMATAALRVENLGDVNDVILSFVLRDMTAGGTTVEGHTIGETAPGGFGFAAAFAATFTHGGLTLGNSYRLAMVLNKTQAGAGPIYPRNMRISAINL